MPVDVPGWEDLIILSPETDLPASEQYALKRDRAQRIAASPTPDVARRVGDFVTFFDNINDLLNAAVITGTFLLPELPRSHPILRGLLTAAKIADLARLLSPFGVIGRRGKRTFEVGRFNDLDDNIMYAGARSPFARIGGAVATGLVLGQALETVAGIGIRLGPIVGAINDLIFSTPLGLPLEAAYGLISPLTDAALELLKASPLAWLQGQTFTPAEHARMALSVLLAWQIAEPYVASSPIPATLDALARRPVRRRPPRDPITLSLLSDLHIDARDAAGFPFSPTRGAYTDSALGPLYGELTRTSLAEIGATWGATDHGELTRAALRQILHVSHRATAQDGETLREGLSPRARIFAALLEAPPFAGPDVTPQTYAVLIDALEPVAAATGRPIPPRGEILDAGRRAATPPRIRS